MIRRAVIGLALITGAVVAGLGTAGAQDAVSVPELNGSWRFEPKRSDVMPGPGGGVERRGPRGGMSGENGGVGRGRGGMGGPGGMRGPGGMGGPGGTGGPGGEAEQGQRSEGAMRRPVRLPDLMHITQTDQIVSFEDSTGKVLQEITTLGAAKDTLSHAPGAQVASGAWDGAKLVVQRQGPRGGKVTETVSLEDKGNLLVIRTKIEGSGDMAAREIKRVYARVTE